ncbi:hypothetical protein TWF481_010784 [Arthrobotrys musiformis]|uniref:C2H2-type domain-containing protein n=1 Tax=Arthrobotrys musiformis TaxID=47236 RepID=A0AAV9W1W5_9PEZI
MTVGITIALLLNDPPESDELDLRLSRSRDDSTVTNLNDHKPRAQSPSSFELDKSPRVKREETESEFSLADNKTWPAPPGGSSIKFVFQVPVVSPRLHERTIKEESLEPLGRGEYPTDFGSQTPEINPEGCVKPDPDIGIEGPDPVTIKREDHHIKEEIEEEKENLSTVSEPASPHSSCSHTPASATPSPFLPSPAKTPKRRTHHRRKSWPCQVRQCQGVFTNKRLYERHLSKEHRFKSTLCPVCGKTLGRKDYMADHIRSKRHKKALDEQKGLEKA